MEYITVFLGSRAIETQSIILKIPNHTQHNIDNAMFYDSMIRYNEFYSKPKLLRRYDKAAIEFAVPRPTTNFPASQFIAGVSIAMGIASTAEWEFPATNNEWWS